MLKNRVILSLFMFLLMNTLVGCAPIWEKVKPGENKSVLISKLGPPQEVYTLHNGQYRLLWPTQPMGETTVAADIDQNNTITYINQVLQPSEFYKAKVGQWTRADVLTHFGRPMDTSYFPLMKREVWTYRYIEDNVWHMLYNFYFDQNGVLRETQKTPDPMYDPNLRSLF